MRDLTVVSVSPNLKYGQNDLECMQILPMWNILHIAPLVHFLKCPHTGGETRTIYNTVSFFNIASLCFVGLVVLEPLWQGVCHKEPFIIVRL